MALGADETLEWCNGFVTGLQAKWESMILPRSRKAKSMLIRPIH